MVRGDQQRGDGGVQMRVKRFATAFLCVTAAAGIIGGAANADPSNTGTVEYDFYDCTGDTDDFTAVKQPGGAAALQVSTVVGRSWC
jgi:hypothetical protein